MWTVIYLVKGWQSVFDIRKQLEEKDILVMTRKKTDDDNPEEAFYEVLVPQAEVEAAQEMLIGI